MRYTKAQPRHFFSVVRMKEIEREYESICAVCIESFKLKCQIGIANQWMLSPKSAFQQLV